MAFVAKVREDALNEHHFNTIVWAATAPHMKKPSAPPAVPEVLSADG